MATSNRIRALNRLPFDFQDGLKVGGVDVTALNQTFTPAGAGLVGFTPVGNLGSTNVQAALAELESEKVGFARLDDTDGSSLVGHMPAGTGAVYTTVQDQLRKAPKSLRDFGGVADYAGTPLYDGADAGRVTATDNTAAFQKLVNAALVAGHDTVRIPAGHWGIKVGNLSFSNFNKLRLIGDGIGVTIIDFIKEDATATSYVGDADAHAIASFETGKSLEFSDMTIKATTKTGVVSGTNNPGTSGNVYYGKVWGFKINNVENVCLTRVRVERVNYRGFSIYGTSTNSVKMLDCEGFYNTGSGFWVQNAKEFMVEGGEFAYNGIFGNPGTGYGVTGSANIGRMIVSDVYAHHNYRKGVDTHGARDFIVVNSRFFDNVCYHIAAPNNATPSGANNGIFQIKGNTFSNGQDTESESWLRTCYQAIFENGFVSNPGRIVVLNDSNGIAKSVDISDNTVLSAYHGLDVMTISYEAIIQVGAVEAITTYKNNSVSLKKYGPLNAASRFYARCPVYLYCNRTEITNNYLEISADLSFTRSTGVVDIGGAYFPGRISINGAKVTFNNNVTRLYNGKLLTQGSTEQSGIFRIGSGAHLTMRDNTTITDTRPASLANDAGLFSDVAYVTDTNSSFGNNAVVVNEVSHTFDFPRGRKNTKSSKSPVGYSRSAGALVARVVIDPLSIRSYVNLLVYGGLKPNPVAIWLGSPITTTEQVGTDAAFTYIVNGSYLDSDGVTKVAIEITTVNAISLLRVDVSLTSVTECFGIEKVEII